MTLSGEMPGSGGKTALHEISWTPGDDGTVTQHWRTTADGGATWSDAFVGIYSKTDPD